MTSAPPSFALVFFPGGRKPAVFDLCALGIHVSRDTPSGDEASRRRNHGVQVAISNARRGGLTGHR
jgi:hypothetical protein